MYGNGQQRRIAILTFLVSAGVAIASAPVQLFQQATGATAIPPVPTTSAVFVPLYTCNAER